ncbi:MAG: hypothetical protein WBE56_12555, partial [Terracidiphilus sp.]
PKRWAVNYCVVEFRSQQIGTIAAIVPARLPGAFRFGAVSDLDRPSAFISSSPGLSRDIELLIASTDGS